MKFILLYVGLSASLLLVQDMFYQAAVALTVCFLLLFIPFRAVKGGVIPIVLFLLFTFGGNLFFHPGEILFGSGSLSVTDEALSIAGIRTLRVFSMIYGAKLLAFRLPPGEMVVAIGRLLAPLERIGIPVKEFISLMGLTVKAFPILTRKLSAAYREERMNRENIGFRARTMRLVSFMVPVFMESLRCPERFFVDGEGKGGSSRTQADRG